MERDPYHCGNRYLEHPYSVWRHRIGTYLKEGIQTKETFRSAERKQGDMRDDGLCKDQGTCIVGACYLHRK